MNQHDFKVGFFLFLRYIRGANIWTTGLITFVMVLTFLNLTVIGGLLEGIVVGSFEGLRDRAIGDIHISPNDGHVQISRSQQVLRELTTDGRVSSFSPRHNANIEIITEDDFHKVTNIHEQRKSISTVAIGVDADAERETTNLPDSLLEGQYFSSSVARREVLIGSALLERYSPFGDNVLSGVYPGDSVYIRIGEGAGTAGKPDQEGGSGQIISFVTESKRKTSVLQKYQVQGVYRTKAGELDLAVIMNGTEVRLHSKNPGNNVSSIAVNLYDEADSVAVRDDLLAKGFDRYMNIETTEDAIGSFFDDIRTVFQLLGSVVGGIGLMVSSITIFIIIFVTAASRSKFIGILKAIGVTPTAIRISYVFFALSFMLFGTIIGLLILYLILVPFFTAHPIPFPFSDGILYITVGRVVFYILLLFIATFIAGLIPAHRIVRRPAIDSVRGR